MNYVCISQDFGKKSLVEVWLFGECGCENTFLKALGPAKFQVFLSEAVSKETLE